MHSADRARACTDCANRRSAAASKSGAVRGFLETYELNHASGVCG
jgi:hypothetical protein